MNLLVIKFLAVGLTVSQVFTRAPDQIQTQFDPVTDQAQVTQLLNAGCAFAAKEFGAQKLNLDEAVELAVENAQMLKQIAARQPSGDEGKGKTFAMKMIEQLDFEAIQDGYKQFCKGEKLNSSRIKLDEVIAFYNNAMKDLPDHRKLKGLRLPGASTILDRDGQRFTELYADNGRRAFVPLNQLPVHVKQAFVAAEDQRFYQHKGVDIRGIVRAFSSSLSGKGRPQGGSTITQQVVKNLVVGDDLTFERKMREMVLAVRAEQLLSKDEILELYMNYVFLGRASWGVEMAARSYFNKSARELNFAEAAFLAGLTKGPNYYHPELHPERTKDRWHYVLGRMKEDGFLNDEQTQAAAKEDLKPVSFESPRSRAAYYFLDEILRDAKRRNFPLLDGGTFAVHSTIHTGLQKAAEQALQDGLMNYEASTGRSAFRGPVGNIADDIDKYNSDWQKQIAVARSQLFDLRFPLAVVLGRKLQNAKGKVYTTPDTKIGLRDGRVASLSAPASALSKLKTYDLVHVRVSEGRNGPIATLVNVPQVQGAIVVMEAKSGRILAMSGGFSYGGSQLNRVTQSVRQPGSTLKPFIYLSALNLGFQPNTLVSDSPISLPPIERGAKWWSPKNYDGRTRGLVTFRQAVERSLNLPTVRTMAKMICTPVRGGCEENPTGGLDYIRSLTNELGIYRTPLRAYPFVLGAQPVRLIDMVTAYAAIANISVPPSAACPNCLRPIPHFFDSIEQDGKLIYQRARFGAKDSLLRIGSIDRVAVYQLRRILEGTLARGTAVAIKDLAGSVAGKTGTSNNENDAWFVGFTNDLVVGVWVGYDSRAVRGSLGARFTGARVAMPIAEKVIRESFELYRPKEPLSPVPADLQATVAEFPINVHSGDLNGGNFLEVFRLSGNRPTNTRSSLLRGDEFGMAFSDAMGEEIEPQDTQFLTEAEEGEFDSGTVPPDTSPTGFRPGADDISDLWRDRGRNVDPLYVQPTFTR